MRTRNTDAVCGPHSIKRDPCTRGWYMAIGNFEGKWHCTFCGKFSLTAAVMGSSFVALLARVGQAEGMLLSHEKTTAVWEDSSLTGAFILFGLYVITSLSTLRRLRSGGLYALLEGEGESTEVRRDEGPYRRKKTRVYDILISLAPPSATLVPT